MTSPGEAVGPFGTTLDAVYDLCPEAERVTDANESTLETPITEDTIRRWILDLSNLVSAGIGPWGRLTGETRAGIMAAARAVVANGAASYFEAARYPTTAGLNNSSYSAVLWARYTQGVEALNAQVTELVDDGVDVVEPVTTGGAVASFPATYFRDGMMW